MGHLSRLRLPRLGETMEEARVVEWLTPEGAAFARGDILLEVETDKTVVEVPALREGVMRRHLVQPGDMVVLDAEIAEVEADVLGMPASDAPASDAPASDAPASDGHRPRPLPIAQMPVPAERAATGDPTLVERVPASPAARKMAARAGIDLGIVPGTGPKGRVQGRDVRAILPDPGKAGVHSGMLFMQSPAGALALRSVGSGERVVVCLHGLFTDASAWRALPERLADAGLRVLVPDLPGHGASRVDVGSIAAVLDTLGDAIDQLHPEGRLVLLGHSFGAYAAAGIAARLGPRVGGLILSAPAGMGLRINPEFIAAMLQADTEDTLRHALDLLGPEAGPMSGPMLARELARLHVARPGHARMAALVAREGVQAIDIRPFLQAVAVVPHVLLGQQDRIFDWRDGLHLPARVALHISAPSGHLPHLAEPALVQELIKTAF
ncbi:MAG: alpha/beta fold hydrolase [Roseinatronobacter sp.]